MRNFLITFLLAEIYYFSGFNNFWLAIILLFALYFLSWQFKENENLKTKDLLFAWPMAFSLALFLYFLSVYSWPNVFQQIFLIVSLIIFYFLNKFYQKYYHRPDFFRIFSPLIISIAAFLFFRSNLFQNFLLKEMIIFLSLFLFFEAYRQIFSRDKNSVLMTLIPALILLEFAWVLNFLPINFLSIAVIWLILFILTNEWELLIYQDQFNLRHYLPEVIFAAVLITLILLSSSWKMI